MAEDLSDFSDLSGLLERDERNRPEDADEVEDDSATLQGSSGGSMASTPVTVKSESTPKVTSKLPPRPTRSTGSVASVSATRRGEPFLVQRTRDENEKLKMELMKERNQRIFLDSMFPKVMVEGKDHVAEYLTLLAERENNQAEMALFKEEKEVLQQELASSKAKITEMEALRGGDVFHDESHLSEASLFSERDRMMDDLGRENRALKRELAQREADSAELYGMLAEAKQQIEEKNELLVKMQQELAEKCQLIHMMQAEQVQKTFMIGQDAGGVNEQKFLEILEAKDNAEERLQKALEMEKTLAAMVKKLARENKCLKRGCPNWEERIKNLPADDMQIYEAIKRDLLDLSRQNQRLQEEISQFMGTSEKSADCLRINNQFEQSSRKLLGHLAQLIDSAGPSYYEDIAKHFDYPESFRAPRSPIIGHDLERSDGADSEEAGDDPRTPLSPYQPMQQSLFAPCLLNLSTVEITDAKQKLDALKETCLLMFQRLQGSAELFQEIQNELGGQENDLFEKIRQMQIDLNLTINGDALSTVQEVEASFFELQAVLDRSLQSVEAAALPSAFLHRSSFYASGRPSNAFLDEKSRLEEQIKKLDEEVEKLRVEITTKTEDAEMQTEKARESEKELEETRAGLINVTSNLEDARRELAMLKEQTHSLEREVGKKSADLERSRKREHELSDDLRAAEEELTSCQKKVDELEAQLKSQLTCLGRMESERDAREEELNAIQKKAAELAKELEKHSHCEQETAELRENTTSQRKQINKLSHLLHEAEEGMRMESEKLEQMRTAFREEKERAAEEKRARLRNMQPAITQTGPLLENLMEENRELHSAIERVVSAASHLDPTFQKPQKTTDVSAMTEQVVQICKRTAIVRERELTRMNELNEQYKELIVAREREAERAQTELQNREAALSTSSTEDVQHNFSNPMRQLLLNETQNGNKVVQSLKSIHHAHPELQLLSLIVVARKLRDNLHQAMVTVGESKRGNENSPGLDALRVVTLTQENSQLKEKYEKLKQSVSHLFMICKGNKNFDVKIGAELQQIMQTLEVAKENVEKVGERRRDEQKAPLSRQENRLSPRHSKQ